MNKNELYNEIAEPFIMELRKEDFIKPNTITTLFPKYKKSDIEFVTKELKTLGILKEMQLGLFIATNQINLKYIFQDSDLSSDPSSLLF